MMLHVRHVLECSEVNPGLRGDLVKLCLRKRLLGVHLKSHNVPHWLVMRRLMGI